MSNEGEKEITRQLKIDLLYGTSKELLSPCLAIIHQLRNKMIIECSASASATCVLAPLLYTKHNSKYPCHMFATCSASSLSSSTTTARVTRRQLSLSLISTTFSSFIFSLPSYSSPSPSSNSLISDFFELPNSGGVKAFDLLVGSGEVPADGDQVLLSFIYAICYFITEYNN